MKRHALESVALLAVVVLLVTSRWTSGCRAPDGGTQAHVPRAQRMPVSLPTPVRAMWVARFHYHYPNDVRTIIRNCAAAGCNTVLWQVRGEATVAYPSALEPWSREYEFQDPGFDPLALAVAEAHRHGLRIEAWINVMPGWKGKKPPPVPDQIYNAHPDWFMYDAQGRRQPLATVDAKTGKSQVFYVILNPCLPEVRNHIARVVDEIVTNYDVDGVHLDYVRYAWDGVRGAKGVYPGDERTLALYRRDTGKAPKDDAEGWHHWRAAQLTRLVRMIRHVVDERRPGASVTAAVWRNPALAYNDYLQDSVGWLRDGLVDAVMPMAYTDDAARLARDIGAYHQNAGLHAVVPGLGIYKHDEAHEIRAQLARCMEWGGGFALFSYDSLYPTAGDRNRKPKARAAAQELRLMRRAVLEEFARLGR